LRQNLYYAVFAGIKTKT